MGRALEIIASLSKGLLVASGSYTDHIATINQQHQGNFQLIGSS